MIDGTLDALYDELPEIFARKEIPGDFEEDWIVIDAKSPESTLPEEFLDLTDSEGYVPAPEFENATSLPSFVLEGRHGSGKGLSNGSVPPPDALAFYLPFHYYAREWWGIYLTFEGIEYLAREIVTRSGEKVSRKDSLMAAQLVLYAHESYHHSVESFAARLEVAHRVPAYKTGFDGFYERTAGTDECLEEALANGYAYRRVKEKLKVPWEIWKFVDTALVSYMNDSGPGYRMGVSVVKRHRSETKENEFAERLLNASFPKLPEKRSLIWSAFPHAFNPIARITSHVKYVVRRDSLIAERMQLSMRYLSTRELKKKLEALGCRLVRQGKGSHERWQNPNGELFTVVGTRKDQHQEPVMRILRQAGFQLSFKDFLRLEA